jgi:hypothetical protein
VDEGGELGFRWSTDEAKAVGKEMLFKRIKYAMREVVNARGGDIGVKPVWTVRAEPVEPEVGRGRTSRLSLAYCFFDGVESFELLSLSRGLASLGRRSCARELLPE